jgi:pimeloyl-ACP methyl ester carboxylesterase
MRLVTGADATDPALGKARQVQLPGGPVEYHDLGHGRPVLFVHGLVNTAALWRLVAPALADRYRCVVPTLPLGAHRLPMHPRADLSPTGIADLLADLLEELDLHDTVVVGNDTGGAFAQILATRHPDRLAGLVLTPCDAFEHFLPWQFRYLQVLARIPGAIALTARALQWARLRRSVLGFGLLTARGIPDEVLASYVAPLRRDAGVRRDLTTLLRNIHRRYTLEAAERLRDFDRPALIAWAANDRVFPLDDAKRLAALLPQGRLEVVPDAATYVPEDQPQRLVDLLHDFLWALPSEPSSGVQGG